MIRSPGLECALLREVAFFPGRPKKKPKPAPKIVKLCHTTMVKRLRNEFPPGWVIKRQYKNWLIVTPEGKKFRSIQAARNAVQNRGAAAALLGMVGQPPGAPKPGKYLGHGVMGGDYLYDEDLEAMEY